MLNSAAGEMAERKTCLMAATETSFLRREARLIIAFVVVAVALLLVFRLGSEIREGETAHFDEWLLLSLRQPSDLDKAVGPGWVRQAMVDITALGGVTALTLLTAAVIGYLVAARRYATATLVAAATISGSLIERFLKLAFERARPTIVPHFVEIHSLSYPSGHATNSAIVLLTLGALLAGAQRERRTRIYVVAAAVVLTVLIGCSRVYVGVHWPTDVIAGWAIGGSWALFWWAVAVRLRPSEPAERMHASAEKPRNGSPKDYKEDAEIAGYYY